MDVQAALFELAKLMLSARDPHGAADALLRRVAELTGARRGFVVVQQADGLRESSRLHFDRAEVGREHRRFSRSFASEAVQRGTLVSSPDLQADPRFAAAESVRAMAPCAAVAAPLRHDGVTYGVLYLEGAAGDAAFQRVAEDLLADLAELAALFLHEALEREELRLQAEWLERTVRGDFPGIVTRDPAMLDALRVVRQVADSDARVLVSGETGVGKELVATALHHHSRRRRAPFVAVSCAALPAGVLESELFGHVRGAFTGAERDRPGRIASAHGGTLFLDEIGEMPLDLQGRLLRVLETGELQRLGADRGERVDVRVVAATHRDLRAMVERGGFRQDLYYRLRVVELRLPPLRERPGDVALLVEHFLGRHRATRPGLRFSADALRALVAWPWPGNVRELAHAVERACLLAAGPEMDVALLPPEIAAIAAPPTGGERADDLNRRREMAVRAVEREFVAQLLARCGGNVSRASRESGIRRSYLQKLIARHGMRAHAD